MSVAQEGAALHASLLKSCAKASTARLPVLSALLEVATALPEWDDRGAASVLLKASDSATRKVVLPDKWSAGRALWEPFPTPGERLADTPLWVEAMSHVVGFRSAPPEGVRTGILFQPANGLAWPELVAARFVVAHKGMLPFVLPGCCLIDVGAHDLTRLAYADFLREREGLKLAHKATRSELLQMYEWVRILDDGTFIASLPGDGAINLRADLDPYHPIRDHGPEGLRAAFASTVVIPDPRVLTSVTTPAANNLRMLAEYLIRRGPHAALSALRLAGLNGPTH